MGCSPLNTRGGRQGGAAMAMRLASPRADCGPGAGVTRRGIAIERGPGVHQQQPRRRELNQRCFIEQQQLGQRRGARLVGVRVGKSEAERATEAEGEDAGGFQMQCPRWLLRSCFAVVTTGQVVVKICKGKIHFRNVLEQLANVGPKSLSVCLLTSCFVGMVFTIQVSFEPSTNTTLCFTVVDTKNVCWNKRQRET